MPEPEHGCREGQCRFEEDMGHRLDVSVKRIVQQNKRTSAELQLHVDESTLLQAENKSLQEERKSLMQVCIFTCLPYYCVQYGRNLREHVPHGRLTHGNPTCS